MRHNAPAMKVLYIGGTGEISYSCILAGARLGHEIAVFNRGRCEEPLPPGVRQIVGDMNDDASYRRLLGEERFDVVCQFRAYADETIRRDLEVFGGRCGQYVFISSASAYQKPPKRLVVTEDTPLENPYWDYSRAKARMEATLLSWHAEGRLPVTIVRPSHTHRRRFPGGIGNGDDWAWRILHGKAVLVYGDGTSLWTLTHSDDFAEPFVRLLGNSRALGEAFHITRHMESYTWNEIYRQIAVALDAEARIVHVPTDTLLRYNPEWTGPLLGDKHWPVLFDNRKVMSVAGRFECKVSLVDGMAGAAEHYRRRAKEYVPDPRRHALFDRIADEQQALGG